MQHLGTGPKCCMERMQRLRPVPRCFMVIQDQDYGTAGFWVVVMVVLAFLLLLVIQRPNRR